MGALDALLRGGRRPAPVSSAAELSAALASRPGSPFERALGVAAAQSLTAWAFAAGYLAAVEALVPRTAGSRAVLCVTESGGNGPAAMALSLGAEGEGFRAQGEKSFVTFGAEAEAYVVLGTPGTRADGRADLRAFVVPRDRAGLSLAEGPRTPFVPEIAHARLRFDGARVEAAELLPGPGWAYARRFRVLEDVHVEGAVAAMVLRWALEHRWDADLRADLYAALRWRERFAEELGRVPTGERLPPSMLLELDAAQRGLRGLIGALPWGGVDDATKDAFLRDQKLFTLAARARSVRAAKARERLGWA